MSKRPLSDEDVLLLTPAIELARQVRAGERSAREILDVFVRRIERRNPELNALVGERIAAARAEAQAIDDAVRDGRDPGPLAGVPFTTKEMASAEGLPVTAGSLARRKAVADRDATYVARLRDAGAILVGVTNQSELGLWWESYNPVYGRTNNPYDRRRTAGGSSGGEGAMVGGGLIGFGIGSDMGGSIRLPSLFCGVFGHKPTHGYVPVSGHFPIDYSDHRLANPPSHRMISIGPMSRHATDLLPLLRSMAGPCPDDPYCDRDVEFSDLEELQGKRVYFLEDPRMKMTSSTTAPQAAAVRRAARTLAERGAKVREWDGPKFTHAMDIYAGMLAAIDDGVSVDELLTGRKRRISVAREVSRLVRGKSRHTPTTMLVLLGDRFAKPTARQAEKMVAYGEKLRQELDDHLGDDGVLILPTFPRPAPRHNRTMLRPFDLGYTALFNALDSPVTAVPMGLVEPANIPTGVQIVGARGNDHLTISAAVTLEEAGAAVWMAPSS